jgi:2,4-didehydro-3-deoxy-L-rhamnonate hydrolase
MRLVRFGSPGNEQPGLLDRSGQVRAVRPLIDDWTSKTASIAGLRILAALDIEKLPIVTGPVRFALPLADFRQITAIGLNYRAHAEEAGLEQPKQPMVFHKSIGSLSNPSDPIIVPADSHQTDWEVELAVVIGRAARNVSVEEALDYVAGYCVAMDVSERDWQLNRGGLHNKGKSSDSFTPVGPWLVTRDEVEDPQSLNLWLDLNGARQQDSSAVDMVFGVAALISHVSHHQTLMPGELLLTGTPAGVGLGLKPPRYLQEGDEIRCGVAMLGEQFHEVVRAPVR